MGLTEEELKELKIYCKIDSGFEDGLIKTFVESVEEDICAAISKNVSPNDFKGNARYKLAVFKQVYEEYEQRGLSSDRERHALKSNGLLNIIHQLRSEVSENDN